LTARKAPKAKAKGGKASKGGSKARAKSGGSRKRKR
jgi:hypothetical protein